MPEYSSRSNDPRITGGLKGMNASDYEMALEVARQPADTASRKKQRKRAENYARAFESRFQKEAYKLSNGNPISAGGPKGYKSPQKVKMNIKESKPKSSSVASKVGGAAGKIAGKAAGLAKSKVKADVKVAKKVASAAKDAVKSPVKGAKTVAGFAAKVAMAPSKAIVKELRGPKRQVGKGTPLKQLKNTKNLKKK
jgi:hypothetical protein